MPSTFRAFALATLCLAAAAPASAQPKPQPTRAEQMIRYRQAGFGWLGYNIGPIGAMVKGTIPFDAKLAERNAATMAAVAPRLLEGFPDGTDSGAPTRAKPGIWQDMPDFSAKMADLEKATADLAAATRSGDLKTVGEALGKTGAACKACHDKYRQE
jgi:cytochrome c556